MTNTKNWIGLIIFISLTMPFANDVFVPSLPALTQIFHTDRVQLMLSVFMFGAGLVQFVAGPCADRYGRKPILIISLSIYVLGSMIALLSNSLNMMLVARFIQALGCGFVIPGCMAILRDSYHKTQLLKKMSVLLGFILIGTALAPLFGSYLQIYFGWRGNFFFLLLLGVLALLIIIFQFEETLAEKNEHAIRWGYLFKKYFEIITHRQYLANLFAGAFTYAAMFGYLAAAPFLFISELHISIQLYGWFFTSTAVVIGIATFLVPYLNEHISEKIILLIGTTIITFSGLFIFYYSAHYTMSPWLLVSVMNIFAVGMAFVRAIAATSAVRLFPAQNAGVAGTLFNQSLFFAGSVSTGMLSLIQDTINNFSILLIVTGMLAISAVIFLLKK
jgi:DHA1 family bicyclomycin/chloramphenicol resistance-like MFS transporter